MNALINKTRAKVDEIEYAIISHPFFRGMDADHLFVLIECAEESSYTRGEALFREGEPANEFFLISSGKVVLSGPDETQKSVPLQELQAGEVLGWSWLFAPFTWTFNAIAVEPTRLITLNGAHLLTHAERDHDFGYELMKRVSQNAIRRLQLTRDLIRHSR